MDYSRFQQEKMQIFTRVGANGFEIIKGDANGFRPYFTNGDVPTCPPPVANRLIAHLR